MNLELSSRILRGLVVIAVAARLTSSLNAQSPSVVAAPANPAPGSIVRLRIDASNAVAARGELAGEPLHFTQAEPGHWRAIGAIPVDARDTVVANIFVELGSGSIDSVQHAFVLPRPVATRGRGRARRLSVSPRFTQPLDSATEARIARENARAAELGCQSHGTPPLWSAPFLKPRPSSITGRFGSGRMFNGRVASRHLGVDFRGKRGAPVYAANRGVVALVDDFFLAGNVVYIDHGGGLVTGYFHLSETLVSAGDTVSRGQIIGRVGASGRVTGPHLHWSARYGAVTLNPLDLIPLNSRWYGRVLSTND